MAAASTGAFGMMDPAYFVGRIELLKWLNSFLSLQYSKIEEVCSGVAFCMIMDALHPGSINLTRVKFDAKSEYEFIHNLKLLQTAFDNLHLDKQLDIPKLVTGKFQNNLDLCQWMKKYFDTNWKEGMSYNAVERRTAAIAAVSKGRTTSSAISTTRENMAQGATPMQQPSPADGIIGVRAGTTAARSSRASIATPSGATGKTGGTSSSSSAPRASLASTSRSTTGTVASSSAAAPRASIASTMSSNRASARSNTTSAATTTTNAASSTARATAASRSVTSKRLGKAAAAEEQVAQLTQQCQQQCETLKQREDEIAQLRAEIQGWQETANAAIKERDFVMSKLQEVEQVYQENEADPEQLKHHLRNILFVDMSIEPLLDGPVEPLLVLDE